MADPSVALHDALYEALTAVLPCPVYDAVPQGAAFPYVTLDHEEVTNSDFLNRRMDLRFFYLTVWSRHQGQREVKEIMAQIDALNEQPLTLSTGHCVSVRVERKRTQRDADGRTYMGQVTLRIITTR